MKLQVVVIFSVIFLGIATVFLSYNAAETLKGRTATNVVPVTTGIAAVVDNISAATLQLAPEPCEVPAWLKTTPIPMQPWGLTVLHKRVKNTKEYKLNTGCSPSCGHRGVGPSILRGLQNLGAIFLWQPTDEDDISDVVYVHHDADGAVEQAIQWKKQGRVKVVVAGPNLLVSCLDGETLRIPARAEPIDAVITPSPWVAVAYAAECPHLQSKLRVLANGVDERFWAPTNGTSPRTKAVMYLKSGTPEFHDQLEAAIRSAGYTDVVRIRYGSYTRENKKQLLDHAQFLVLVTRTESQGIAAAEAWAMDVPTLVWASFGWKYEHHATVWSSPAPYLTPATGAYFSTPQELQFILTHWQAARKVMHPRQWMLDHLTDTVAARQLLYLIHCHWILNTHASKKN